MDHSHKTLTDAILQTIAYSDIFDYPLTTLEIHRYLTGSEASFDEVEKAIGSSGHIVRTGSYFTLAGREDIVSIRMQREMRSRALLPRALRYGSILGLLPFVRMVTLTGSLAVMNVSKNADFDYMLVTAHGRVWTARAFAVLFTRLAKRLGYAVCPNLIVSEAALEWPLHDLYSARELCQMIPITGTRVYRKLIEANNWAKEFLPNGFLETHQFPVENLQEQPPVLQKLMELPFRGKLGERFERWEMKRKITRFSNEAGFGEETIFTADVCQGNFHHHRKWTRHAYEAKLAAIGATGRKEVATIRPSETVTGASKS